LTKENLLSIIKITKQNSIDKTEKTTRLNLRKEMKSLDTNFMKVEQVAEELGVSKSFAYKIVQKLNAELKEQGYLTVAGRVSRKYFLEKLCYSRKDGK
jgi:Mn-dependent DtxR family transcriptional regulator